MEKLWKFTDNFGSFISSNADNIRSLYFPLANEALMSSISPDLHGDIKTGQNSFLLQPVSRIDLANLKSSRNFWVYIDKNKIWSATGVSKALNQIREDKFYLEAGLLWHKTTRENKKIGLKAEVLSFVPASGEPVEVMQVKITNITSRKIKLIPTAAIPIYGRSADNLRDHRQVTSLLQRITLDKLGVIVKPTLRFEESGHKPNKTYYFVLGYEEKFIAPQYIYPTQEMFCGEGGDLETPHSVQKNLLPNKKALIQGKEAMGALRFRQITLSPLEAKTYILLMGVSEDRNGIKTIMRKFNSLGKIKHSFEQNKKFWMDITRKINLSTGNSDFDNWFRWVTVQPALRKIFGCSFLPDFDYGKGGRGWRDLWQDCLGLILSNAKGVRQLLINNFSGVRIDGSNATLIGKKQGEFIADRNNISRVWMDHGIWPLLTLDLYIDETGDFGILFEEASYFRDHQAFRSAFCDYNWDPASGNKLKTKTGKIYAGSVLEHLLAENLVEFFNVGIHNHIRLEGADWNDGLDMACEKGESVAFSCMYAYNLELLSRLLLKIGQRKIKIARELKILLANIDNHDAKLKQRVLQKYFERVKLNISGKKFSIDSHWLAFDLKVKSVWLKEHIRKTEWLKEGFFNGYYDNTGRRVEGKKDNITRMILSSQVLAIMSGTAEGWRVRKILENTEKYLLDKKLKSYHLNTDFKEEQHNLGRAFSFVYGDKENGAFFNHMIVMFAYALYRQGRVKEGWKALSSIYNLAMHTQRSNIYPCLPEYFNLEGRGMYSYLTGSASWFVLTIRTEVFGIKGKDGNLLIEPKLCPEQFQKNTSIGIDCIFAGKQFKIEFCNPKRLSFGKYNITEAVLNKHNLILKESPFILIDRKTILGLAQNKVNNLAILLG